MNPVVKIINTIKQLSLLIKISTQLPTFRYGNVSVLFRLHLFADVLSDSPRCLYSHLDVSGLKVVENILHCKFIF